MKASARLLEIGRKAWNQCRLVSREVHVSLRMDKERGEVEGRGGGGGGASPPPGSAPS